MCNIRKTIIVRLAGGFGNQIFQFGAALLLSSKARYRMIILDDYALSSYKVNRNFDLSRFMDFSRNDIQIILQKRLLSKLRIPKLLSLRSPSTPFVSDSNFQDIVDRGKSQYRLLDGYFQNLRQRDFENIVTLLKPLLYDKLIDSKGLDSEICVTHVRGGDFVELGWDGSTPKQYYMDAMSIMCDRYEVKSFLVVTDDKYYAENIISSTNFNIEIISNDMDEDFWTIASYSKRILSASTFALWASALGRNDADGVVIAPNDLIPGVKRTFLLQNEIN
jgi:hypothetical protein